MENHYESQSRRDRKQKDLLENNEVLSWGVGCGNGKESTNSGNQGSIGDQEVKRDQLELVFREKSELPNDDNASRTVSCLSIYLRSRLWIYSVKEIQCQVEHISLSKNPSNNNSLYIFLVFFIYMFYLSSCSSSSYIYHPIEISLLHSVRVEIITHILFVRKVRQRRSGIGLSLLGMWVAKSGPMCYVFNLRSVSYSRDSKSQAGGGRDRGNEHTHFCSDVYFLPLVHKTETIE